MRKFQPIQTFSVQVFPDFNGTSNVIRCIFIGEAYEIKFFILVSVACVSKEVAFFERRCPIYNASTSGIPPLGVSSGTLDAQPRARRAAVAARHERPAPLALARGPGAGAAPRVARRRRRPPRAGPARRLAAAKRGREVPTLTVSSKECFFFCTSSENLHTRIKDPGKPSRFLVRVPAVGKRVSAFLSPG